MKFEPIHEILVLMAYAWVKVQNFKNPELLISNLEHCSMPSNY